jgi:hypothetical protein
MEILGKLFVGIMIFVIDTILIGFILMCIWGWFILPVFPTLPTLGYAQSMGLVLFLGMFTHKIKSDEEDFGKLVMNWITIRLATILLFGLTYVFYLMIY